MTVASGWELEHQIYGMHNQFVTRWGPSQDNPDMMVKYHQLTGMSCYICNCGLMTGWVARESLPLPSEWIYEHMSDEDKERWLEGLEPGE